MSKERFMQSQKYNSLLKLITNDGGHIKVNRKLIAKYGIETACVYCELVNMQISANRGRENYLFYDLNCFALNTEKMSEDLGISPHKQRLILQTLQADGLIQVYYGAGKNRMIKVNDNSEVLQEILNPAQDSEELFFENLAYDINVLKKAILKGIKQLYRKEEKDKFNYYLKKYYKNGEERLFQCVLEDKNIKKELAKLK